MDTRELKGLEIAARMRVVRDGALWSVPSQTGPAVYRVDPDAPSCTCEDFGLSLRPCKHVYAVRFVIEREGGAEPKQPAPDPDAKPHTQRPTYRQAWPAYVRAQKSEKDRFQVLLAELCRGVEEPPRTKTGRKPVPLADAVFVCAFKVYSTVSGRRFNCDLQAAHAAGHVSRPIHPHKISALMESPGLTPILRGLIAESARPLAAVESTFAADSTGFGTSKFERWFDVKHGKVRSENVWVKAQAMCGVKTNIVTSAFVCPDGSDAPHLPAMLWETVERFTLREVVADKGYSSGANHDAAGAVGATPFIPFKVNATGAAGGPGSLYERMFFYFSYRRDEFLKHYHARSNSESVFSAVKRKFGDALRSKTATAMENEVLCKFLCHNLCVLIQEQEELGITAEFWDDGPGPEEEPAILKFPGMLTWNGSG